MPDKFIGMNRFYRSELSKNTFCGDNYSALSHCQSRKHFLDYQNDVITITYTTVSHIFSKMIYRLLHDIPRQGKVKDARQLSEIGNSKLEMSEESFIL